MNLFTRLSRSVMVLAVILMALTNTLLADGNETLGPPSLVLAGGSGYVAAGIGLAQVQPGVININVPAGATVTQVLLYWEGQHTGAFGDDQVTAGGNNVVGTLIGGPNYFYDANGITPTYSSTYRADITSLGLVAAGANAVSIDDLDYDFASNGAGLFVIYDEGLPGASLRLLDGNDLAYKFFSAPRDVMVAQTFTFDAATVDRTANTSMFFSSVQGLLSTGGVVRPNEIKITVGATVYTYTDELISNDGQEWDTFSKSILIPAGETSLTVEAFSGPGGDEDPETPEDRPASFAWNVIGMSIPCSGLIGDFVWKDLDCDGTQDVGEPGIPGVTVQLLDCSTNAVIATDITDENGYYSFEGLCAGCYTVKVDETTVPAGYTPTTCSNDANVGDNSNCSPTTVTLTTDTQEDRTIDFGYCEPPPPCLGKIGDFVWKDSDCDGTQEGGEPGIAGVTVKLYDGSDNLLQTTVTNASGYYIFDSLCAGNYKVKVDGGIPAGWTPTTCSNVAGNGTNSNCSPSPVTLATDNTEDLTIDFGYCEPSIPCVPKEFIFCGNTSVCGTPGNIRTFTVNGTSVKVSAFSRNKSGSANWQTAYLGLYSLGLGVTDRYESGNNGTHRVDNIDKNNYVMFEFNQAVVVDKAFLDAIVTDSDVSVYYGTFTDPYNNHLTLSDAVLGGMLTEQNETGSSSARFADFNAGQVLANVLVIAADVQDTTPEDWFKIRKLNICAPPPPPPPCVPGVIQMTGNTSICGSPGNIRTFSASGVSVKASAWSRNKSGSANWQTGYLGAYSSGLGVTDKYENGNNGTHRVDNIDKNNYVLFEFSQAVKISRAYLDAIVTDSDVSIWYGTFTNPYNNHITLNDAVLASMTTEQNLTESSSARWASFNAGQVTANVLVIAADVQDTSPEDWFKIRKIEFICPTGQGIANPGGDVEEDQVTEEALPTAYQLMQNFPNPFNPTTQIHFELPEGKATTLKIFNTLGQEIKTLVDGELEAGVHMFTWDATDNTGNRVASGVYFYQLRSGEFSAIKKMSLMK